MRPLGHLFPPSHLWSLREHPLFLDCSPVSALIPPPLPILFHTAALKSGTQVLSVACEAPHGVHSLCLFPASAPAHPGTAPGSPWPFVSLPRPRPLQGHGWWRHPPAPITLCLGVPFGPFTPRHPSCRHPLNALALWQVTCLPGAGAAGELELVSWAPARCQTWGRHSTHVGKSLMVVRVCFTDV